MASCTDTTTWYVGDKPRISVAFADSAGVAVDPTTVVFKIKLPDASVVTYNYPADAQLVRDSTGHYHVDFAVTTKGTHVWSWTGTGTNAAVAVGSLVVEETGV